MLFQLYNFIPFKGQMEFTFNHFIVFNFHIRLISCQPLYILCH